MAAHPAYARIGAILRAAREELGYTQMRIAGEIGVAEGTYSRYEAGKLKITIPELVAVARLLGVPLADVLSRAAGDPDGSPPRPAPDLVERIADRVVARMRSPIEELVRDALSTQLVAAQRTHQPNRRTPARLASSSADYRYLGDGVSGALGRLVQAAAPIV